MRYSLLSCHFSAACALYLGVTCCSLVSTGEVLLQLPPIPPDWGEYPENPGYILTYTSSEGGEVELELPPLTETVSISLDKGNNQPVLLTPYFGNRQHSLKPAGALYPLHCTDQGTLSLSWEEGFLADLFLSLDSETIPVENINSVRMSEVVGEAGEGDPWSLDKERIIQVLRFYSFRSDYVSPLPGCSLDMELSEGVYLWNNPFFSPFQADEAGIYTLNSLYEGEHILFPLDGSEPVRVVITGDEWFIFYPEYVESGSW